MRWRRLIPVGGAALGGIVGAPLGVVAGAVLAIEFGPPLRNAPHEALFDGLAALLRVLVWAGLGGIALAVGGAVLGSWLGTRFQRDPPAPRP